jgi:hypothetical protein
MANLYVYAWGNNLKRKTMKGRRCRIVVSGRMNSCMIEFLDNGQRELVSQNSVRPYVEPKHKRKSLGIF